MRHAHRRLVRLVHVAAMVGCGREAAARDRTDAASRARAQRGLDALDVRLSGAYRRHHQQAYAALHTESASFDTELGRDAPPRCAARAACGASSRVWHLARFLGVEESTRVVTAR